MKYDVLLSSFLTDCAIFHYISFGNIVQFDMIQEVITDQQNLRCTDNTVVVKQGKAQYKWEDYWQCFCTLCMLPWEMVLESVVCTLFNPSPNHLPLHSMINFQMSHWSGNLFCNLRFTVTLPINMSTTTTTLGLTAVANQCIWPCDCDFAVIFQHSH